MKQRTFAGPLFPVLISETGTRQRALFGALLNETDVLTGSLNVTEAADTLVATGKLLIQGTLSVTEAADTLVATGNLILTGIDDAVEAADTLVATGVLLIQGAADITEAADTLSATGALSIVGSLTVTEAADTLVADGRRIPLSRWERRANRMHSKHGELMVLAREGEGTTITLKGRRVRGSIEPLGNSSAQQGFRVRIGRAELKASAWLNREPARKDKLTAGGRVRIVLDVKPLSNVGGRAMYELEVAG